MRKKMFFFLSRALTEWNNSFIDDIICKQTNSKSIIAFEIVHNVFDTEIVANNTENIRWNWREINRVSIAACSRAVQN